MIRLIQIQLKQLLPFVLLWTALVISFYAIEFGTSRIDETSYLEWCSDYCAAGVDFELILFTIFLYMIATYSLFPREFDTGTIDFVRSLPLSRGQIFIGKVFATWLLICLLITAEAALHTIFLAFNTQTLTGKLYWHNDLLFLIRNCLFAFVIVAHVVFISWFRTIGLILYSAYLIALIWLEQARGVSGVYNLFAFFNNEYYGQKLIIDWTAVATQTVIAIGLLIASYFLWTSTDSKPRTTGNSIISRFLPIIASIVAFIVAALTLGGMYMQANSQQQRGNIQQTDSSHYLFAYKQADEERMLELKQYVDADYQALAQLLGVSSSPLIHADMTSQSRHALGVASYKKIRMVLSNRESVNPVYRRVLSHETAHVFQSIESERELWKAGNTTGFFVEGMAQYTSFELIPDPLARDTNWAISSVAWQRHNISFEALANRSAFEELYDPELLYGIGDIWVDALVRQCGEQSLGNFLRTIAKPDNPKTLSGSRYWSYHLSQIGCDLQETNYLWTQTMQQIVDSRTDGAYPDFANITTSKRDNHLVITADVIPGKTSLMPKRYYIRSKGETKVASPVSPLRTGTTTETENRTTVEFTIPLSDLEGSKFRYQIGFVPYPDSRYFFEKWRSGSVPKK